MQEARFTKQRKGSVADLIRWFDGAGRVFAKERETLLHEAEIRLRNVLNKNIMGKLPGKDMNGHVRSWQSTHWGSRRGYVAIRPIGKSEGASTGDNSPAAITRYLERGRGPRPSKKGRAPRWKVTKLDRYGNAYISGYGFYSDTTHEIDEWAEKRAQELQKTLEKRLEG